MLKIEQLTSASLTAEWESKLIEIEENKYSYEEFIREIENLRDEIIQRAKEHPDWYTKQEIYYAKQIKKALKKEKAQKKDPST